LKLDEAVEILDELASSFPSSGGSVGVDWQERLCTVTLDNPSSSNAVTFRMLARLGQIVRELEDWSGGVILLRGAGGRHFCAGSDLNEVMQTLENSSTAWRMSMAAATVLDGIWNHPAISIAALQGPAIGGGAELACACDMRIAARRARIHFVHARLGVVPGWGATRRLVESFGRSFALRCLVEARPVTAEIGQNVGLFDVVLEDPFELSVEEYLSGLLSLPIEALRGVKEQIRGAAQPTRGSTSADVFGRLWGGQDHQRALKAVLERISK
jgi:enoyl-CoA hydratase/carnithine racemase